MDVMIVTMPSFMNFLDNTQNHQWRALHATECKFNEKIIKVLTSFQTCFFFKEDQHCGKIAHTYSKL